MFEVKGREWDGDGRKVSTVYLVSIHVSVNIYNGECCCGRSSIPKRTTRNYFRYRNGFSGSNEAEFMGNGVQYCNYISE